MQDKQENKFYVYVHRRASDNKPFYVGKGHGRRANTKSKRNLHWLNTYKKHGLIVEILYKGLTEKEAFDLEKDTILEMRYHYEDYLCNLTDGGEGTSGFKHTGTSLERVIKHIKEQSDSLRDKNIYKFYHLNGEIFEGTRQDFCNYTNIPAKKVAKLFQKVNARNVVFNWSLKPIEIKIPDKKELKYPQKRNTKTDDKVYTFYHVFGDTFTGTRQEFSDYSRISLVIIAALFCKNPRKVIYGWSLNESTNYMFRKI